MRPLDDNKNVSMYIATHCTDAGHNKVYIFVVVLKNKKQYLARCWGKYGGTLTGTYDQYNQEEFQKLINEKGTGGYKIVDNAAFAADEHVWGPYAEGIAEYVKTIPTITAGLKTTLPY